MEKKFNLIKRKRYNFTSNYNVKLYKKCLSLKLIFIDKNIKQPNLIINKNPKIPINILKTVYARKEKIPLRLFRFFFLLDYNYLINLGVKFLVAKKLSVYNGKRAKLINITQSLLEITLKCNFKFGDLIFTRARYKFKKKKRKSK